MIGLRQSSAPGKLLLLGEYAVLQGAPALVTAIDRRARVSVDGGARSRVIAPQLGLDSAWDGDIQGLSTLDSRLALVEAVLDELGQRPKGELVLDTGEFFAGEAKLGFGSSAALAVALLAAGDSLPNPEWLFRAAHRAHRRAQGGVGSGADIAASCWGGTLAYRPPIAHDQAPSACEPLRWPDALEMIVVWTGAPASTPDLIRAVDALGVRSPEIARARFDELAAVATEGIEAFRVADLATLLTCVDRHHTALTRLGEAAGAPMIEERHARAHASVASIEGAAYKPSGAGGGDLGIALCSNEDAKSAATQRLLRAGFSVLTVRPDAQGVRTEES